MADGPSGARALAVAGAQVSIVGGYSANVGRVMLARLGDGRLPSRFECSARLPALRVHPESCPAHQNVKDAIQVTWQASLHLEQEFVEFSEQSPQS